ncbi:MAG: formylmethanofuran dehydrogenase subunit C [Planctomycetota bacterium]
MPLTLTLHQPPAQLLEVEGLTPDWTRGRSLTEIERFEVFEGNRRLPLAEFFHVSGDAADECINFSGDLSRVHWIGAQMATGRIHIDGPAGRHVGSQMRGGRLIAGGHCGDYAGTEMIGGSLEIHGNAGALTGGAYRGSTKGMTGGTIIVHGQTGDECGAFMRRGMIAIAGSCGDFPGYHMIAGTIAVSGPSGRYPGAGMKRGTIALLHDTRPPLLPSFTFAASLSLQSQALLLRRLTRLGFAQAQICSSKVDMFRGDAVTRGLGEILFTADSSCSE